MGYRKLWILPVPAPAAALALALGTGLAGAAWAEPVIYRLDAARSAVEFDVTFDRDLIRGTIPVRSSAFLMDLEGGPSRVEVVLNADGAKASFPFAEQALKGPRVLATKEFPDMVFFSDQVRASAGVQQVPGRVTIRGVTRPVMLSAQVFRQQGTGEGDLTRVAVHLSGTVSRADFGADGWADMVGDEVRIRIVARLDRAP